jgi:hypothetical protein
VAQFGKLIDVDAAFEVELVPKGLQRAERGSLRSTVPEKFNQGADLIIFLGRNLPMIFKNKRGPMLWSHFSAISRQMKEKKIGVFSRKPML